ncbi:branched-chain amino acid transport system permease [Caballeronia arationis]|uniref:Monosaccharide ABC transporter membrane protein, CUT2 family n=2 Tax=Caballeronia arationis TaxID=1777142 RepID=A0A7Z7IA55_9BURK|nr:branched-chain amino acid transport system permease [Caballeronia arationis]SOE82154.1 monosaccharide ABC transporter membrane protein, CUT2 family [Caballeronia arationis]
MTDAANEPRKLDTPARPQRPRGTWMSSWAAELRILLVAVLLAAYFEFANHDFLLTNASLVNLSQFIAPVAIIAFGEIMLMIGGDIDLSAGMVFAFAPFMMVFANDAGAPMWLAVIAGLLAAAVIGFVNGAVTVWLRLPSFVTTLGTLFLINGITLTLSRGTPAATPGSPTFAEFMGAWGYSEIIWTVVIAFVMHTLLRHTRWGLHTQAAGANPLGASEAGIHVNRLRLGNFILAAVLAGFTGILEGFRITSIDPQAGGNQIMFLAVAAAVIGGTPLTGGSGTIVGGLLGATVLGILNDGFTLIGINAFTFNIILGAAILAAMIFNIHIGRIRRRRSR